jgi:16S rRNA (cytosine967-C5)-methyltransferase
MTNSKPTSKPVYKATPKPNPNIPKGDGTPKVTPARRAAFEILTLVGDGKGHSDELLHSARTEALSPEDRNLATALVMGVLRWQIALDARIHRHLQRPDQRLAAPVALSLRLGAFQLLHMDRIPAHAALSESVELCKLANQPHAAGMVNAILRKIAAAQKAGMRLYESVPAFAERLGHPVWLVERWAALYGRDIALAICEAGQQEPAENGDSLFGETGADLPNMDPGSRLVAELAAAANPKADGSIWDACAAPGGKTLLLALRAVDSPITATDVSKRRLTQMQARLRRYPYAERVTSSVADATAVLDVTAASSTELFDLILCDVPCTGTGTLARNPEIRHILRPEELARQGTRQRAILSSAFARLAPGGRLIYSTCSLEPEENERVVLESVEALPNARRLPIEGLITKLAETKILSPEAASTLLATGVRDGALRTLPGVHPTDGFYAAVLERTAG